MSIEVRPNGVKCNIRCSYCLPPDAPILKADLTYCRLDEIAVGDVLVGFSESAGNRTFAPSIVEQVWTTTQDVVKITTTHGVIESSMDHKWLSGSRWRKAKNLSVGDSISIADLDYRQIRGKAMILRIETLPAKELIDITTSTRTFIAYGLATHNCYEESMREASPSGYKFDIASVKAAVAKLRPNDTFSLFGGEPLIVSLADLEELLKLSFERTGSSGLQTNGTLITEAHIELFRKYKTNVGISVDGPGALNDVRVAASGSLDATRKLTERTQWAIDRLCEESKTTPHLRPSIITTLHKGNFSANAWPSLIQWFHKLDAQGIQHVNLHVMEMDHNADQWYLPPEEVAHRLIALWDLQSSFKQLRFLKFQEVMKLLQGDDQVVCVWKPCDPWNTSAVNGIEGDGSPSHCSRTNKDGVNWLPAEGSGDVSAHTTFIGHPGTRNHERQLALYNTPQELGGCQGCAFWMLCFGNCPGTGAATEEGTGADWRYRTSYCSLYKTLFEEGERRLIAANITPFSKRPDREALEKFHMEHYLSRGQHPSLRELERAYRDYCMGKGTTAHPRRPGDHGDHTDHGDHGDQHGDSHGDHTDMNRG